MWSITETFTHSAETWATIKSFLNSKWTAMRSYETAAQKSKNKKET